MGKDVTDKSDGTIKSDESLEVQSVREENRRLFELVDRLIATQESEQKHRKIIETELQKMKFALVEKSGSAETGAAAGPDISDLSKNFEQLLEKLGAGLEAKLLAKIDSFEKRLTALPAGRDDESPKDPKVSEELVNAIWKMIAPLGGELERMSATMQGLGERVDKVKAESAPANPEFLQELKALAEEIKQARSGEATGTQVVGNVNEALEGLNGRLEEVSESLQDLVARHDDAQAQTSTLLRGLVESNMERLSREWAGQIAGFQRSVDNLLLDRTSRAKPTTQDLSDSGADVASKDQTAEAQDAIPNVVTGDFPAFQKTDATSSNDEKRPGVGREGMSQDLKREMRAMDAGIEAPVKSVGTEEFLSEGLGADLSSIAAEGPNTEDALLTKPADWRTESETDDEAILLSHPIVTDSDDQSESAESKTEGVQQVELANETAAATSGRREIDLRAFKDLRLSNEPGDDENPSAKLPTGARGPTYENAPAEASLTRFVRLIRARKRSSPS